MKISDKEREYVAQLYSAEMFMSPLEPIRKRGRITSLTYRGFGGEVTFYPQSLRTKVSEGFDEEMFERAFEKRRLRQEREGGGRRKIPLREREKLKKLFSNYISERLGREGMSSHSLAKKTGTLPQTMWKWKQGLSLPDSNKKIWNVLSTLGYDRSAMEPFEKKDNEEFTS